MENVGQRESVMTWHAQDGDLVLQGDEANLFRDAILFLCDEVSEADDDRDIADAVKRIWMCIDGTQTIKMTVTLTAEVPASLEIKDDEDGYQTIRGCFPSMIIMQDDGEGGGSQVEDDLDHFFMNGCVMDHSIEVVGLANEEA